MQSRPGKGREGKRGEERGEKRGGEGMGRGGERKGREGRRGERKKGEGRGKDSSTSSGCLALQPRFPLQAPSSPCRCHPGAQADSATTRIIPSAWLSVLEPLVGNTVGPGTMLGDQRGTRDASCLPFSLSPPPESLWPPSLLLRPSF